MTARASSLPRGVVPSIGAAGLLAIMLLTMPLVSIQGPAHMTIMDAVNFIFIAGYWSVILARRDSISFPLAKPFWVIMLASTISLFAAADPKRSLLTLSQDVYLYVWFVTLVALLARSCRLGTIAAMWAMTAALIAGLTTLDGYTGALGGQLAGTARAIGTFANPNMYGNYLLISFFVTWAAAAAGKPLLYVAMLPIAFGIFQTASNGALLGLVGGCAAAVIAYRQLRRQRVLAIILIVASIGVAVLGIGREDLINATYEMMSGKRGEIGGAALKGAEERVPLWIASAQVFSESPIGVGPNNFDDAIGPLLGDYHGAHSEYVGMLIERGPLGFAGWCAMLVSLMFALRRMRGLAAQGFRPFAIEPLYGALGALAAQAFVIELFHFRHFWLLLALVFAVDVQASRAQSYVPPAERRAPARARMLEAA